jgi:hypothetical protein
LGLKHSFYILRRCRLSRNRLSRRFLFILIFVWGVTHNVLGMSLFVCHRRSILMWLFCLVDFFFRSFRMRLLYLIRIGICLW